MHKSITEKHDNIEYDLETNDWRTKREDLQNVLQKRLKKCQVDISYVSCLICTLYSHNLLAQPAAIDISSLGPFRDDIIYFVKSAI